MTAKEFYLRKTGWIEPEDDFNENTWDETYIEDCESPESVVEMLEEYLALELLNRNL